MPTLLNHGRIIPIRFMPGAMVLALLVTLLAACGNSSNDGRSFAPEAGNKTPEATSSPFPAFTPETVNMQPNEGSAAGVDIATLAAATGPATALTSGLAQVSVTSLADGAVRQFGIDRSAAILASASPDGSHLLLLDRSTGLPVVTLITADLKSTVVEMTPEATPGPPAAPGRATIQLGDTIAWSPDGSRVAVAVAGRPAAILGMDGSRQPISLEPAILITAMTWSQSGQSLALGTWNRSGNRASIATLGISTVNGKPTTILQLAEGDGRLVRSMAWGSESVGIVFALRSATSDMTQSNDLYGVRRLGDAMRLVASAGVAAPIAAVDQVAIASDGTTLAFSVQVPGQVGLRFDSIWIMDASASGVARLSSTGIRRIAEMEWTARGLVIVGTRRVMESDSGYQLAVVEVVSGDAPVSIAQDRSPATPVGSPVASPINATPAA